MKTKRQYSYSVPIPANVPPAIVVSTIQSYIIYITCHQYIFQFKEIPPDPSQAYDDPFFGAWDDTFRCFHASDYVTLAPRLTKTITYQVLFKSIPDGIRSRALAPAGVTVRSEYVVRPRNGVPSPAGSDSTGSSATVVGEEYELIEEMEVEANSMLMPFVADKAVSAHRHIIAAVLDQTVKTYFGETISIPWENDGKGTWRRIASS